MYIIGNLFNKPSPNIIFQSYPINEPLIFNKKFFISQYFQKSATFWSSNGKAKISNFIPSIFSKLSFIQKVIKMLYNVMSIGQV